MDFFDWGAIGTILAIAAPTALIILFAVDWVLDRIRENTDKLKEPGWIKFDEFVDQVRKFVGSGPISQLTERGVITMARHFYDQAMNLGIPIDKAYTREQFVERVLTWYRDQVEVEGMALAAYEAAFDLSTRTKIAALRSDPEG